MLLNSHISAYARCLAGKICGLVPSTWGTSLGENKPGARDRILNAKVVRRACAGQTFPLRRETRHKSCPDTVAMKEGIRSVARKVLGGAEGGA